MNDKSSGFDAVKQTFRGECNNSSNDICPCEKDCIKTGVPGAFRATALVQWLLDFLKVDSFEGW